jgi:hypothetical protein
MRPRVSSERVPSEFYKMTRNVPCICNLSSKRRTYASKERYVRLVLRTVRVRVRMATWCIGRPCEPVSGPVITLSSSAPWHIPREAGRAAARGSRTIFPFAR